MIVVCCRQQQYTQSQLSVWTRGGSMLIGLVNGRHRHRSRRLADITHQTTSANNASRWLEMDPGLLLSCGAVHVQEVRGLYIRLIVQTCGDRRSSRPSAAGPVLAVFLVATPSTSIPPSPACALAAPMASSPRSVGDVIVPKPEDPPAQAYQGLPSPLAKW